jgi:farnesyl diphosphate synthase
MESDLLDSYEVIEDTLLNTGKFLYKDSRPVKDATSKVRDMLSYTLKDGNLSFGNAIIKLFESVKKDRNEVVDQKQLMACHALGWSIQLIRAFLCIADDIMDGASTRGGKSCWHTLPEVGLTAVNDALILQNALYILLHTFLKDHLYYTEIQQVMMDSMNNVLFGQIMDSQTKTLDIFDMRRFNETGVYKLGYLINCGMRPFLYLVGIGDPILQKKAEGIVLDLGILAQALNDYADVYSARKVGTDIIKNKCTWLICRALEKASAQQRRLLQDNYGVDRQECVAVVKSVFEELDIRSDFHAFEERELHKLITRVQSTPDLPQGAFKIVLEYMQERKRIDEQYIVAQ